MDTTPRPGRPRSEAARTAVLHAVDDLLVEEGYAAMTLKGIAERAGVSRQTVYRWWSTKAEILLEAAGFDAAGELGALTDGSPLEQIAAFLEALVGFLTESDAGAAYRALIGEAQHDPDVARLMSATDVLGPSAQAVVGRAVGDRLAVSLDMASALLIGPVLFWVLSGQDPCALAVDELAAAFLAGCTAQDGPRD